MPATLVRNSGAKSLGGSTSNAYTWPVAPVVGNKILVLCANYPAPTVTVTDNASPPNTYTKRTDIAVTGDSRGTIWEADVVNVPTATTVSASPASDQSCVFTEWSGLVTGTAFDQQSTASNSSAGGLTSFSSGTSPTLTQADELVLCLLAGTTGSGASGITTPSGYTALGAEQNSSSFIGMEAAYKVVAATTGVSATWGFNTLAAGAAMTGSVATFKIAASGTSLTPGQAAVSLAGQVPTIAQTANQSVTPGQGALAFTGQTPVVARTANQAVTPSQAAVSFSGQVPTVTQSSGLNLIPGNASIAFTGQTPTVAQSANQSLIPGAKALTLTGPAPVVAQSANQAVLPSAGALVFTGRIPSVVQASASVNLVPGTAGITLTGWAPLLEQSGATPYTAGVSGPPVKVPRDWPLNQNVSLRERKRQKKAALWALEQERVTAELSQPKERPEQTPRPVFASSTNLESPTRAEQTAVSPSVEAPANSVGKVELVFPKPPDPRIAEAEMQVAYAASEAIFQARRRRNEEGAVLHALALLVD